jgi:hypothetical protein
MIESFYRKAVFCVLIALIAIFHLSAQTKKDEKIKLHKTAADIVTDGKIGIAEWREAQKFSLSGGGKIFFKYDGAFLHVGVRGSEKGWCHLYLTADAGEEIRVFHASAALGAVVYRRSAKNSWQPENSFAWNLREKVFDEQTVKNLAVYLAENGWKANNNNLGGGNEIEFSIKIEKAKRKKYKLAAVYTSDGKKLQFFPSALAGDTLRLELLYGKTPPNLDFKVKSWTALSFK